MGLNRAIPEAGTGTRNGPEQIQMLDRQAFYEQRAAHRPAEQKRFYNRLLRQYYSFFVPAGARVLEVGCGTGDLLASVKPCFGVGIDFSPKTIEIARERHPPLEVPLRGGQGLRGREKV